MNHAPIGTSNTVTALEDTPYVFSASDFGFTDPNDSPANNLHSVKITTTANYGYLAKSGMIVTMGSYISVSDINAGNLTFIPMSNSNGTPLSSFTFQVKDDGGTAGGGVDLDATARTMTINVTAVNDAPSFMAMNPMAVAEDVGPVTNSWFVMMFYRGGGSDESSQTATAYNVTDISNPSLFSASPAVATNGTLTYTPAPNANGTSTFKVAVQDSGGTANGGQNTSATQTFTITVNAVNDAPSFSASNPPATDMCVDPVEVSNWIASFNPGGGTDESSQTVIAYTVTNVGNPSLFSVLPAVAANGKLTYTLALYVDGTSTFDVKVKDSGGILNGGQDTSPVTTFTLQVNRRVTFTVNTTNDTADANVGNGIARDNANNTSLRAAIMEGNAAPAGTIVSINFTGAGIGTHNLGIELPALNRHFRITGPGSAQLTVQRLATAGDFRVFTIGIGAEVVIRDLTIANGRAYGAGSLGDGGGVHNSGSLEVYGAVFENNTADRYGGAIANAVLSVLIVSNCDLHFNTAEFGGAIATSGEAWIQGATSIYVNHAVTDGGGVYNSSTGQLTISGGTEIYSNSCVLDGAGIINYGGLVVQVCLLYDNYAGRYGGGLANWDGTASLTDVIIQSNRAGVSNVNGKGGGFYVRRGTVTLNGGTISGNICTPSLNFNGAGWAPNFPPTLIGVNIINQNLNQDPNPPA